MSVTTPTVSPPAAPKAAAAPGVTRRQGEATPVAKLTVLFVCTLWIIPTLGLLITSFRTKDDANSLGWWTIFADPAAVARLTTQAYGEVIAQANLDQAFVNSLAIALPATFIPLLIASFAAYAFAFMTFPGRNTLFIVIVSLLVVPNYVALVPILQLYGDFRLTGTFPAAWLAHIGFGMSLAIYILRNYMATLPKAVLESARIDGASHFTMFWRLIMPMSVPALASFAIFQFLWVWNDLLVALVFIGPGENQPITVAVQALIGQQGQGWQLVTAGGFISMVVPIFFFLALQRFFVRGLTAGSVKG
ncbi:carbohydrate ABC transporter permease [Nonomuraea sp. H19]|uniref:carbohydrate ABC transporter permease n=1 Tax=Nonomuraea sp. H19 TaxID=3452206 RepID=UPI003F8912CC